MTCFLNKNRLMWEHWMILPSGGHLNTYIVKSYRDGKNLAVRANGRAYVQSDKETYEEWWLLEKDS